MKGSWFLLIAALIPGMLAAAPPWEARAQTSLNEQGGALVATLSGSNPGMIANGLQLPENVSVTMRYRANAGGGAALFFATASQPRFAETRKDDASIQHDNLWREATFFLEASAPITRLRLDMASSPGEVSMDWIEARDGQQALLRWDFGGPAQEGEEAPPPEELIPATPEALHGWTPANGLAAFAGDGHVILQSNAPDPQFVYSGALPKGPFEIDLRLRILPPSGHNTGNFFLFFGPEHPFQEYEFTHLHGDWYEVTLQYTGNHQPTSIRFDPVRAEGNIELDRIEMYRDEAGSRTLLRSWDFL